MPQLHCVRVSFRCSPIALHDLMVSGFGGRDVACNVSTTASIRGIRGSCPDFTIRVFHARVSFWFAHVSCLQYSLSHWQVQRENDTVQKWQQCLTQRRKERKGPGMMVMLSGRDVPAATPSPLSPGPHALTESTTRCYDTRRGSCMGKIPHPACCNAPTAATLQRSNRCNAATLQPLQPLQRSNRFNAPTASTLQPLQRSNAATLQPLPLVYS
jgi:hypothetical protein